ncbi:C69 family dipeptidase [Comamonas sp. JC664]|uniref:dipeptidase n=1 Tax=Comamonas sp. JC664 TaxID=2801917 RepID=UPI00174DC99B|nr:C69 family dipeptidase [Comamonas sp. JC664]MBL0694870.1 C69 family dipeptidase [Comamonas sp. JC664]GHG94999.1 peptidase C69 [Comamonas sp. KCTC 72670]
MNRRLTNLLTAVPLTAALVAPPVLACTSMLVSKGATTDGATFVTYAADAHELYGELYYTPARHHAPGAMRDIVEWDTGKFLGRIPQPAATYSVVGNMNEHQLSIGESTFGGREELAGPAGIIDYGSLIYTTLERAKTAREAIQVMTTLVAEHGYASSGESFSIADPKEAWLLEMIGKGKGEKGAVWVARKLPDGYLSAHANQARIGTFPLNDKQTTLYSPDVISFARAKGWFKGADKDFNFAETYNPIDFGGQRFSEARVWSIFRRAAPSMKLGVEYANGAAPEKRLPLWVKPDKKLSVQDTMALMRDHFEGTPLDMTKDVGAGPYAVPYRWRPMTWEVDGKQYVHERAISTQQTGFSFVAQMRDWLPAPIGGVLWFGVDDTFTTVYTPMYAGIRQVPRNFAQGVASRGEFSWDSSFWVFNWVSNQAYARWSDIVQDVQREQGHLEGQFLADQADVEKRAQEQFKRSPEEARQYLTDYSLQQGEKVHTRWRKLGETLLVKYIDGNVRDDLGKVNHPKYQEAWYRRIVQENGKALAMPAKPAEPPAAAPAPAQPPAQKPAPKPTVAPAP